MLTKDQKQKFAQYAGQFYGDMTWCGETAQERQKAMVETTITALDICDPALADACREHYKQIGGFKNFVKEMSPFMPY